MATAEVSHGRGGAGKIDPDNMQYVDGAVVHAGPEDSHNNGAFRAGRGGESQDERQWQEERNGDAASSS